VEKRQDFQHAAEEIEDLFADLWQVFPFSRSVRRGHRPQVDVLHGEDPETLTVLVELPGVDPDAVKLVAAPRALVIAGERRRPTNCGHYEQLEIEYGPFQRRIPLDEPVDPTAATARYEQGMLTITLPIAARPPEAERVTIVIRGRA
jgi:HSP20 family molecular chaperone IbpA